MGGGRIRARRRAASPRRRWFPTTSCRWTSRSRFSRASMGYSRRRPCCSIGERRSSSRRASASDAFAQPSPSDTHTSPQAHAGPKKLATGGSPFEVFVWQRSGASRGVVDGEELTLREGDCCLLPKATQYAWDLEDGVMLSVANAFT